MQGPLISQPYTSHHTAPQITLGWREYIYLPQLLGSRKIKAKIDTGARTSALHAFAIKPFKQGNKHYIAFEIHPLQHREDKVVKCTAEVKDIRWVTDSGGHRERRYVIDTLLKLGDSEWTIEITLTNRDTMNFRMLLGRTAVRNKAFIDPGGSFVLRNLGSG